MKINRSSKREELSAAQTKIRELEIASAKQQAMIMDLRRQLGIYELSAAQRSIETKRLTALAFESEIIGDHTFDGLRAELSAGLITIVSRTDADDLGLKIVQRGKIFYMVMLDDERVIMRSGELAIMAEMRGWILDAMGDAVCYCEDLACENHPVDEQISASGTKIPGRAQQIRYCTMAHCCDESFLRELREEVIDELG